jgi:hypothetical protein
MVNVMKQSPSWIDNTAWAVTGILLLLGVYTIYDAQNPKPAVAQKELTPVSYCAVELVYRTEETPGELTETSVCVESSFKWSEHVGKASGIVR